MAFPERLRETSFHKYSCWRLASISGRQLAGEEWALAAGAKKLKLKLRGKEKQPEAHMHNNQALSPGALPLSVHREVSK